MASNNDVETCDGSGLEAVVALSRSAECGDGGACEEMGDGCKDCDIAAANALSVSLLLLLLMGGAPICSTCLRRALASSV